MRSLWCACAVVVASIGCGKAGPKPPAPEDVMKQHKPEMAALLGPVRAKVVGDLPILTRDGITGVKGPLRSWADKGNAVVLTETQLEALHPGGEEAAMLEEKTHDGKSMGKFSAYGTIDFVAIAWWAADLGSTFRETQMRTAEEAQARVDRFLSAQYVIVLRFLSYQAPDVTSGAADTFKPGLITAEARVFDVKGGDHGGFRFTATNSDNITARQGDTDEAFGADLEATVKQAFDAQLAKLAPGSSTLDQFISGTQAP